MKTKLLLVSGLVGLATWYAQAEVDVRIGLPAPRVVVAPPAPVVVVPDTYVWDGYENVGYANGTYFYLSGDAWLPMGPDRIGRFHDWERSHRDWRDHAIRNDQFRHEMREREGDRNDHQRYYDRQRYDHDRFEHRH